MIEQLREEKANAMHLLGKVLRIRGDYEKAERNLQIALNIRKLIKSNNICDTLHELGVLSLRHHEYTAAYTYLTDSLKLKKDMKKEMKKRILLKNKQARLEMSKAIKWLIFLFCLSQDYDIERYVRDLRVHQILEGTNEIMRHIVGKAIVS